MIFDGSRAVGVLVGWQQDLKAGQVVMVVVLMMVAMVAPFVSASCSKEEHSQHHAIASVKAVSLTDLKHEVRSSTDVLVARSDGVLHTTDLSVHL